MKTLCWIGLIGIATAAMADEFFVPAATHVRIANPGANVVTVQVGEEAILLGPRETFETTGNVRIAAQGQLEVTATNRTDAATMTVPVLDVRDALDAGFIPLTTDESWVRSIAIVNPAGEAIGITIDGRSIDVAANAVQRLDVVTRGASVAFTATRPVLVYVEEVHRRSGARVITKARALATSSKRRSVRIGPVPVPEPQKQTVTLTPSKDATLFEISNGSLANGDGVHLFAGTTATGAKRRALVHFDVAAQIPAGSKVTSVSLTMTVSANASLNETFRLFPVTTNWSEGASNAGFSRDGGGTTARTGDATWLHASFSDRRWTTQGGDFSATADATATVTALQGTWTSAGLVTRVQAWVNQPATNFGWIVIGDESRIRNAKRFDSSEVEGTTKPALTVEFER